MAKSKSALDKFLKKHRKSCTYFRFSGYRNYGFRKTCPNCLEE